MDWINIVKTVAPWLGTAIAGPLGGMAISTIADALGVPEKTSDAIKTALTGATPEQMLALKTADQGFQERMQELGFQNLQALEAIAAKDRDSARELLKTTRSWVPAALTAGITAGYFIVLIGLLSGKLSVANDAQALLLMIGSLNTTWGVAIAFWFGTTVNSGRAQELLAASGPAATNSVTKP